MFAHFGLNYLAEIFQVWRNSESVEREKFEYYWANQTFLLAFLWKYIESQSFFFTDCYKIGDNIAKWMSHFSFLLAFSNIL